MTTSPSLDATADRPLGALVRRGLAWSTASTVVLRLGSLATGIVLARLLSPAQFGIYAIALTVQSVVVSFADLGLSTDLIRSPDAERRAPTVATLAVVTGLTLSVGTAALSVPLARTLGSAMAAPAIALLSVTVFLAGLGVVPFAWLQRRFDQRSLFVVGLADFIISNALTIGLVLAGWGVIALAIGRVAAQAVSTTLQFILAKERPRFGLDRSLVRSVLAFGVPVAGANLISWSVLGLDKLILGRAVGPTALGFYVLAFNISAWPMTLLGQAVRAVALPYFSRTTAADAGGSLGRVVAPVWAAAVLGAATIGAVAHPLVILVYGTKWATAAVLLIPLVGFGAMRILFDVVVSFLYSRGRSSDVFGVQVTWLVVLAAAIVAGVAVAGAPGAALAHVSVALFLVLPLYLRAAHRAGAGAAGVLGALWPPAAAGGVAAVVAGAVASHVGGAAASVVTGASVSVLVYAAVLERWALPRLRDVRSLSARASSPTPVEASGA